MNLVVDIGNTSIKVAAINGGDIVELIKAHGWDDTAIKDFFCKHEKFSRGIVSTVREETIPLWLNDVVDNGLLNFSHKTPIPIYNGYQSPSTLGLDRLAAAVGANNIYPNSNVLVVDCGTAITVDVVTASGKFEGGNITLGLDMRFKALSTFTSKLPKLNITNDFPLLGKNTNDAISAGVLNGAIFELNSYFDALVPIYPNIKVLFTGGDAFFFDGKLKNPIFVLPNLVVLGLNRILEYNV